MRFWVGVAVKEHVARGMAGSFCQLNHGKAAPLRRLAKGDWILYYSPKIAREDKDAYQQFTAVGHIVGEEIYQVEVSPDFAPFRRDVQFLEAQDVPIRPMLGQLSFIGDSAHWGQVFRYGLLEIPEADFVAIATQMTGANPLAL